jgi:hypothetical protein
MKAAGAVAGMMTAMMAGTMGAVMGRKRVFSPILRP